VDSFPALEAVSRRLADLARQGLERRLTPMGPRTGPRVMVDGRDCLLMASNDYLGLANHPRLAEAALEAVLTQGAGSGASRLVSGTLDGHAELERAVAEFKRAPAALTLSTGYMTNLAVVAGLAGPGDLVVSDELNHASIIDACRLSRARVRVYPHGDAAAAAEMLEAEAAELKLLVTDGVFSMDGDVAPLPELLAAASRAGALAVVDDAHATGVWGASGRGTAEHFGLEPPEHLVMVGTFSKALGGAGGFVAADRRVLDLLVHRARPLLYSTAPPPGQAAAALAALQLVDQAPELRERLWALCARLRAGLAGLGLRLASASGPIAPVLTGGNRAALALGRGLWERGVYAPAIRPPTVPEGAARVRLTVTAAHSEEDVDQALEALAGAAKEAGL
jgi:glycine C-acetyltransferase/8-amino-7-oxononanoate synthase